MKQNRWKKRFVSFDKSLTKLIEISSSIECDALTEIERDSLIKRFELAFELSWNLLKDFLELQGTTDLYGSRNTYRTALERGLINNGEIWMEMIESRIQSAHVYDEEIAQEIAVSIYNEYIPLFNRLQETFNNFLSEQ